jgi:broad specificity phosphatase PhoE
MDKELYIIRHGETELNRLGIVQGRGVNTDLNDTGRAQAAAFYERYKDIPFQKIYTSKEISPDKPENYSKMDTVHLLIPPNSRGKL